MRCPRCGSLDHVRMARGSHLHRRPRDILGATFRLHECRACGKAFASMQTPVSEGMAHRLLERIETPPSTASESQPERPA